MKQNMIIENKNKIYTERTESNTKLRRLLNKINYETESNY